MHNYKYKVKRLVRRGAGVLFWAIAGTSLFAQTSKSAKQEYPKPVPTPCIISELSWCSPDQQSSEQNRKILKRLDEISKEDAARDQRVNRFIQTINTTNALLKNRTDILSRSVAEYLQRQAQHSDGQLLESLDMLTDQLEAMQRRLDALQRDPITAPQTRKALLENVGDDLANLQTDQASQALDAIAKLDKKIDDLAVKIDCSSATPEALAVAIQGQTAERTFSIWHCRPENLSTGEVQTAMTTLFDKGRFPAAKDYLDTLLAKGFNPLKEIKPTYYAPLYRSLSEGNVEAVRWLVLNAPKEYWRSNANLFEECPKIMRLPWSNIPEPTVVQMLVLLRQAGVPADTDDYKAFTDLYKRWLATQLPNELKAPINAPNAADNMMARQMGYGRASTSHVYQPGEAQLWKAMSDALAPSDLQELKAKKLSAVTEGTQGDLRETERKIQELNQQLEHRTWWRKLPETQVNMEEAARHQQLSVFDSYGYVPVSSGTPRDDDVLPSSTREPTGYPNCVCWTAGQLRALLASARQRRQAILDFRASHSS